ncbi:MAG: tetratricopeptide repeat protein [Reyranellaceae bacterium]
MKSASLLLVAVFVLPLAAQAQSRKPSAPIDHSQQYTACMNLAKTRPREAYVSANAWYDRGGDQAAQHCAAIALFGMGDYVEAANRLDRLADGQAGGRNKLRAELYAQAGQAWLLASYPDKALVSQSNALALLPDSVDFLIDRALTYAGIDRLAEALRDLNRALALAPRRHEALTLRATVLRVGRQPEKAAADIDQAIRLNPNYPEAYLERGLQRKAAQPALAREDFIKVLRLVPEGSDLAAEARKQLEGSDLKQR